MTTMTKQEYKKLKERIYGLEKQDAIITSRKVAEQQAYHDGYVQGLQTLLALVEDIVDEGGQQ
jgi:hypothetical protein